MPGVVHLVGAGPGDPGLMTRRGLHLLRRADVVACDRLVARELLSEARTDAEIIDVGKEPGRHTIPQEEICALIVDRARKGLRVVRLKGGDPFVFGRGFEELTACREAGVRCIVVPGVSSAIAAPAAAGIPITHRQLVRAFAVVTGRVAEESKAPPLDFAALAAIDAVVLLMGRENLGEFAAELIKGGRPPATPAACIEWATTRRQRVVTGTLGTIANVAERNHVTTPMVTVIGEVARFAVTSPRHLASKKSASASPIPVPLNPERSLSEKSIVITRPRSRRDTLRAGLLAAGADVIDCPLIRIAPPSDDAPLCDALRDLFPCQWLLFTSAHGVASFFRTWLRLGLDLRGFSLCRIAAVGPATAAALARRGFQADLVPTTHTADALAEALVAAAGNSRGVVFCPRSDVAPRELPNRLEHAGFSVHEVVAYRTVPRALSPDILERLQYGIDAIVFCSPSAVRVFAGLKLPPSPATVACIGPATEREARNQGWKVDVVAETHSGPGMVLALQEFFDKKPL